MKTLTYIFLSLILFSCSSPEEEQNLVGDNVTPVFFHSYVACYIKGEMYSPIYADEYISIYPDKITEQIFSPDTGRKIDEMQRAEYQRLAERYGDTSYNRKVPYPLFFNTICFAETFSKVDVICTNRDLDLDHPAGSSINDLMRISYISYAPYIRNNYTGDQNNIINKLISELKEDDLMLIEYGFSFSFSFDKEVEKRVPYQLEITFTTTEGKTYTVEPITFRPL